jgi:hypoxanthine phosphoribosyltransferase
MHPERCSVLIDAPTIAARITALGAEIAARHQGQRLTAVCVLKGSFIFMADLLRAMPEQDVVCEFLGVSSYEGTQSTGAVRLTQDLRASIEGKHVLLVEDIVDTGLTLAFLKKTLLLRGPASLQIATLLDKPSRRKVEIKADYVGFEIPDAFVVGYGLDLDQEYRNLPYIGVYRPPV